MAPKTGTAVAFALVVGLVATIILTHGTVTTNGVIKSKSVSPSSQAQVPNPSPGSSSSGALTNYDNKVFVLPPPNQPLEQIAGGLRREADRGNGAAGCRLAMEFARCLGYWEDKRTYDNFAVGAFEKSGTNRDLQKLLALERERLRSRVARDDPICANSPSPDYKEVWSLLLNAAQNGHVPSMSFFASRVLEPKMRGSEVWDIETVANYRRYAYPFLKRAADEGNLYAIEQLGFEHIRPGTGTRPIPFDPVQGLAYLYALVGTVSPAYRAELSSRIDEAIKIYAISPDEVAQAASLTRTVLPQEVAVSATGADRPSFTPSNQFGCN